MYCHLLVKMENREHSCAFKLRGGIAVWQKYKDIDHSTVKDETLGLLSSSLSDDRLLNVYICLCDLPLAGQNLNYRTEFGLVTKLQGILVLIE